MKSIRDAFEAFMQRDFYHAVLVGTRTYNNESTASTTNLKVELAHNGNYRLLWNVEIGRDYRSKGLLLPIPPLSYSEFITLHRRFKFEKVLTPLDIKEGVSQGIFNRAEKKFRKEFENSLLEF